ncbi:beta strand repeat-containing protein, partial [Flavobacterium buctense]|uniref:beta strand repeat-containing protein n=1 Tax=Flavobacterium terrisoli TaxID=3242195 RepID=UPI002542BFA7
MKTKLIYCLFISMFFGVFQNSAQVCQGFTTFTQGGWGTQCHGGNAGCYRDANFDAAFPDGIRIGNETNSITLTSSEAVNKFLPSGTTARALDAGALVDPGHTYKNVLAGQLVALTLNVGFDAYDANFGSNTILLGDLSIVSGPFQGMTVSDFLVLANAIIGGTDTSYSFSQVNAAASAINENFDNGTIDNGFLDCQTCPNCIRFDFAATFTNVLCFGQNTGTITLTTSEGTAPYSYFLNNVLVLTTDSPSYTFTGLAAGSYVVTVNDSAGNSASSDPAIVITQSDSALTLTTVSTTVSCEGTTGTATVTAAGGTAPYTILWSNGSTDFTLANLAAGNYTAVVTDANGCQTNASVLINTVSTLTSTFVETAASCDDNDGTVTVTATAGTSPYTILWSNGSTAFTLDGLASGTYTYTVTDVNGCQTNGSVIITVPANCGRVDFVITSTNVLCFGQNTGTITMTTSGATAPYSYFLNNVLVLTTDSPSYTFTGLAAGSYIVTVNDSAGNSGSTDPSIVITQSDSALTLTTVSTNVSCEVPTGTATVTAAGGTAPYTILWSNGSTDFTLANLAAGTYTAVVTDANGCQATTSVTIENIGLLQVSTVVTNGSCIGATNGSITVTASNGTAPYTILWANASTSFTLNNLLAGTYTAVVTDATGCTVNISETITGPTSLLSSTYVRANATCCTGDNGTITVTPVGGTAPYTILWANGSTTFSIFGLTGGTYSYTVTDFNGCTTTGSVLILSVPVLTSTYVVTPATCAGNDAQVTVTTTGGTTPYTILWSNGATTFTLNNLLAGTYTYTVTDANGCQNFGTVTIVTAPTLVATTTQTNVSCFAGTNGSVTATVTGGTSPYTILWSNGATTFTLNNLLAGIYTGVITSANGCTANVSATVTQPTALVATTTQTNVSCFAGNNGSVTATVTGGTSPYTILWSNGATTFTLNNLLAGTYTGVITSANGCTANVSATVTQPTALVASTTQTNVSCFAGTNGSVTATVTGGTSPYTILWSNGATTFTLNNLLAGIYTGVITSANGCTANVSATVTQPTALVATTTQTNVSCFAGTNGSVTATVTGGTSPYTILWSNGATTFTLNNLLAGIYTGVITSANGCTANVSATVTQPTALVAT